MKDDYMRLLFRQPPWVLRPNGRGHWGERARVAKRLRVQARLMAMAVLRKDSAAWEGWVPASYDITWFFWAGLGPDADNVVASCKALIDGCADAFGVNDRELELGHVCRVKVKRCDVRAGYVNICFNGIKNNV
jgi:hypothetical protein